MNKIIDQTFKVAIYLRLSKEDDDLSCSSGAKRESNSISNQRKLIYDFMKLHPELELYDEYKDDGKSGSNFDRAEFQRMMKDIEAGKVNCVVVKDQSRFGRDYIDVGKYKEKIFPKLGVRFITINEGYDSRQPPRMILPLRSTASFMIFISGIYPPRSAQTLRQKSKTESMPEHLWLTDMSKTAMIRVSWLLINLPQML